MDDTRPTTDRKHGAELIDDITTRIDDALSGYETQRAGDGIPLIEPTPVGEVIERIGQAWIDVHEAVWGFVQHEVANPLIEQFRETELHQMVESLLNPDEAAPNDDGGSDSGDGDGGR